MVLAELTAHISERLKYIGDGWVFGLKTEIGTRQSNLRQAGPDWRLAGDERCAACRAALLPVPIGKHTAFFKDTIYIGRPIAHYAVVVGADIEPSDVITPDDQDVWFFCCHFFSFPGWVGVLGDARQRKSISISKRRASDY